MRIPQTDEKNRSERKKIRNAGLPKGGRERQRGRESVPK